MPYDAKKEIERVVKHYSGDPLQKRFSAIISGETNAGKTYLIRSARMPVHIDSFDPGGTKCLIDLIRSESNPNGQIVADTRWEREDPLEPSAYEDWKKETNIRFQTGYFDLFGTYCLDGLTTFAQAVMGAQLKKRDSAGEVPMRNKDYHPQKVEIQNYVRKLMNLSCDFIVTGHLREIEEILHIDNKTGLITKDIKYRLYITGQAVITLPLLFDELYVITGKGNPPKRKMMTDSLGKYIARSRLRREGKLEYVEDPDIKKLLKKAGLAWEDKPRI